MLARAVNAVFNDDIFRKYQYLKMNIYQGPIICIILFVFLKRLYCIQKEKQTKIMHFFQIKKILTLKYFKNVVLEGFWSVVFQDTEYGTSFF